MEDLNGTKISDEPRIKAEGRSRAKRDYASIIAAIVILAATFGLFLVAIAPERAYIMVFGAVLGVLLAVSSIFLVISERNYREQNRELIGEVTDLNLRFGVLADTVSTVSSTLDTEVVIKKILEMMMNLVKAPIGVVLLPDEKEEFLKIVASYGFKEAALDRVALPIGEGSFGKSFTTGSIVAKEEIKESKKPSEIYATESSPQSQIVLPMFAKGSVIGVVSIATLTKHVFSENEVSTLSSLCHEMAVFVENLKLYQESQLTLKWLEEMQEYVRGLIEEMGSGVIVTNEEGKIVYFNEMASETLGIEKIKAVGLAAGDMPGETRLASFIRDAIFQALENDTVIRESDLSQKTTESSSQSFDVRAFPLHSNEKKITGAGAIFSNITAIREMERRLRQKENLSILGQMAANIAHELRNPLFAVSGLIEELEEGSRELCSETLEMVRMIGDEVNTCNQWVSGILAFSRDSSIANVETASTDIADFLRKLILAMIRRNRADHIVLREIYEEGSLKTKAGKDQLRHIFGNVLENAIHAMPDGGTLEVALISESNGFLKVSVADEGCGIPQGDLERIFEPFYTTKTDGTGLGLSIAKKVAEDLGGMILVKPGMAAGTVVEVVLPLSK